MTSSMACCESINLYFIVITPVFAASAPKHKLNRLFAAFSLDFLLFLFAPNSTSIYLSLHVTIAIFVKFMWKLCSMITFFPTSEVKYVTKGNNSNFPPLTIIDKYHLILAKGFLYIFSIILKQESISSSTIVAHLVFSKIFLKLFFLLDFSRKYW